MKAREDASQALLNYGYNFFETQKLRASGEPLQTARVWKAEFTPVQVGLRRDLFITVPRGKIGSLKTAISIEPLLVAPLSAQKPIGTFSVTYQDQVLEKRNVYPLKDVPQGGWWRRMVDAMLLWFE